MAIDDNAIDLGPWTAETVEYRLDTAEPGQVRGEGERESEPGPEHEPRVALPTSTFDCIRLDVLKDHPAVDAFVRAELEAGMPFRLLRFPFSLRAPDEGRVEEVRYAMRLLPGHDDHPRVHSIYPERLEVDRETTTEVALEPSLSIGSAVDVGLGRLGRTIVARQPRSTTVGFWSEHGAEWEVRPPAQREGLEGSWEFFVVVRWARDVSSLRVTLALSATVAEGRSLLSWRTRRVERSYEPLELSGCLPIA